MASAIKSIRALEIQDSRGNATLQAFVITEKAEGTASVPAGASTGSHEAVVVEPAKAVANINGEIAAALAGKSFDQQSLDDFLLQLDGTPNKARLGGNALLGVSMAFARAAAAEAGQELFAYIAGLAGTTPALPCPMFNVINGGKHAPARPAGGDSGLAVQEFLLVPAGLHGARERLNAGMACAGALKVLLEERGESTAMGDEGGYAPRLAGTEAALDLLLQSVANAGYAADDIRLSLDAAASSFKKGEEVPGDQWAALAKRYRLLSIEDPFAEDDPAAFAALQKKTDALIVGDDLTVTQAPRIAEAARTSAIRAVILKPNQVGTVSEAFEAARTARTAGLTLIASHRSGETNDAFIADFAAGLACEYLKAGAPTRPERMIKYNRLMDIAALIEKPA